MNIEEKDLKDFLLDMFDVGFNSPNEMMEQEVERQLEIIRSKYMPSLPLDKWTWSDYPNACKMPDPWLTTAKA